VAATWVLLVFGTLVRVRQYAARTSFWRDEAFVVLNVRHLSIWQLMGKLKWDQAAPPLFLWALRGMRQVAGESELSLRLVALVCAVAGLIVFADLARRLLPAQAAFFAIGLLVLGRRLIEFSAEVKQYSGDVLVSALIVWAAIVRAGDSPARRLARVAIVAAIAVWFSHTAAIVFAGVGLVLTVRCLREGRRAALWAVLCDVLFLASFATLYIVSIRKQHTSFLYDYWATSFPPWHRPAGVPLWLAGKSFQFLQTPYRWAGSVFALLLVLSVAWAAARKRWESWALCAAPLAMLLLASMVKQYPFDGGGRLTLFLMPQLFLLCGAGAAFLLDVLPTGMRPLWWALPAALLGTGIAGGLSRLARPVYHSHIRPAVEYVKTHRRPGEAIVLVGEPFDSQPLESAFNGRHPEALCYWPDPPGPLYVELSSVRDITQKRFWVLAAFGPGDLKRFDPVLERFRAIAVERDRFIVAQGGGAFLFERAAASCGTGFEPVLTVFRVENATIQRFSQSDIARTGWKPVLQNHAPPRWRMSD
jgi:hypothetical protein